MRVIGETVDCADLKAGSWIDVETKSRHYQIECLGGNAIRISGHPHYCPTPVEARLEGSITDEGRLERGVIEPGTRLLFVVENRLPVTTSRVLHVRRAA
jgi:hypothetical protein